MVLSIFHQHYHTELALSLLHLIEVIGVDEEERDICWSKGTGTLHKPFKVLIRASAPGEESRGRVSGRFGFPNRFR